MERAAQAVQRLHEGHGEAQEGDSGGQDEGFTSGPAPQLRHRALAAAERPSKLE